MKTDFGKVIKTLKDAQVEFIVIGGVAGIAHGLARATFDIDILYSRNRTNIQRLVHALKPHQPYLRGAPPGLPFSWDEQTVRLGLNFTLITALGDVDALGEVTGAGSYEQLRPDSVELEIFDQRCRCVTLERLIQIKRAAGRAKDLEMIAQMQALLEERRTRDQ
jgi:predicted nucleotidyltransferase